MNKDLFIIIIMFSVGCFLVILNAIMSSFCGAPMICCDDRFMDRILEETLFTNYRQRSDMV